VNVQFAISIKPNLRRVLLHFCCGPAEVLFIKVRQQEVALISPSFDVLKTLTVPAPAGAIPAAGRLPSENCAKIRDLGFTASRHMKMYGERFEIVSDPFDEDGCIAVHAISGDDPTIRTLRLPVAILVGLSGRFRKIQRF
jgi:hypothetical protein